MVVRAITVFYFKPASAEVLQGMDACRLEARKRQVRLEKARPAWGAPFGVFTAYSGTALAASPTTQAFRDSGTGPHTSP